ncbi:hypothetical protein BH23BAC2_BH23BAC2_01720 [soil metagenome]
MDPIVYAGHLALETVEDLENYLNIVNSNVVLHPAHHHKIQDVKGSLNQVDIPRALQQAGLQYYFDGHHYHILRGNKPF